MQVVPLLQANFTPVGVFPLYHLIRRPPGGKVFESKTLAVFAKPSSLPRHRRWWPSIENSVLTKPGYHPTVQASDQAEEAVIAVFSVAGQDMERFSRLLGTGLAELLNLEGSYLQCHLVAGNAPDDRRQGPTGFRFGHISQGRVGIPYGDGASVYGGSGLVYELALWEGRSLWARIEPGVQGVEADVTRRQLVEKKVEG